MRGSINKIRLSHNYKELFSNFKESGMGYHIVTVTLRSGKVINNVVVLNGEFLIIPRGVDMFSEEDITQIGIL